MEKSGWIKAGLLAAGISILLNLVSLVPCLGYLFFPFTCLAWFALPIAAGYFAAEWSKLGRDNYKEAAINGALAGIVLGVISGIVSIAISIAKSLLNLSTNTALSFMQENSELSEFMPATFSLGWTLLFGCVGIFVGVFVNVLFSTIGGIINIALSKK